MNINTYFVSDAESRNSGFAQTSGITTGAAVLDIGILART